MSSSCTCKTTLEKFDSDLWGYHFPVPKAIADPFIDGTKRRVVCLINGEERIQCALMPAGSGDFYILVNKKLRKKLQIRQGDEVMLELEKDTSTFGMTLPESFASLLIQDPEGKKWFDQLTPGKQRSLIYLVGQVKNTDSQITRGMAIMDHLKHTEGVLDFKVLTALIKQYNQYRR